MRSTWIYPLVIAACFLPNLAHPQTVPAGAVKPSGCPLEILHINPSLVTVRVRNVSGKGILGLSFRVAPADATEHWKWIRRNPADETSPLHEFGWNRALKPGATKTLAWDRWDLVFAHGGGGAFVLTNALFDDGSDWESPIDSAPCKGLWFDKHKKVFVKPIILPPRE